MGTNPALTNVKRLIAEGKILEARQIFNAIEEENTIDYYFMKGLLYQKLQNLPEAINAFIQVLELDPEHQDAKAHLHLNKNILNFWNPEMFNP